MSIYDAYQYCVHGNKNGALRRLIDFCTLQLSVRQDDKHAMLKSKPIRRRFICRPTIVKSENEGEIEEEAVPLRTHRRRNCAPGRRFVRLPTIVESENEDASDAEAVTTRNHRRRCRVRRPFVRLPTIAEADDEDASIEDVLPPASLHWDCVCRRFVCPPAVWESENAKEAMFENQQAPALEESDLENEEQCQEEAVAQVSPVLRRSTRQSKPPSRYNGYECYLPSKKRK
jgi:hypothetical protein